MTLKEIEQSDAQEQNKFGLNFMDKMTTISGIFYPKDYIVCMVWSEEAAQEIKLALAEQGYKYEVHLLSPQNVINYMNLLDSETKIGLPSVGTERATVQKYIDLAKEGQWAILVKAPSDEEAAVVVNTLRKVPFSYAQKYHLLAMEDIYPE